MSRASVVALAACALLAIGGITMAQNAGPQLTPPRLETVERSIAVPGGMFPVLMRLQDGRLAAVVRGGAPHVGVGGLLNLVTSSDGVAWSDLSLIVYMPPDTRDWAFGQAADGRLIMAFCVTGAYTDGQHGFQAMHYLPWFTTSDDGGAQWSNPQRLEAPVPYSSLFGKIITLADGTVLLHGYGWYLPDQEGGALPPEQQGVFNYVLRSTDNGKTWGEPHFIAGQGYNETALCALPDGRVLAVMRGGPGLSQSISSDGGRTWSAPEVLVEGARVPADVILLKSGKLLMTFGRRIEPFGVEAVLSGDEYGTWDWTTHRLIEWEAPNTDCGYPSSAQLDDGTIVTLYYKVTNDPATPGLAGHVQVWCARYKESDLAGQ
jgi:hypothetical protein